MIELSKKEINNILSQTEVGRNCFTELFFEKSRTTSISLDNNKIENVRSGIDAGTGFRLINGGQTYYGHVNSFVKKDVSDLVTKVSKTAQLAAGNKVIKVSTTSATYDPQYKITPYAVSFQNKIEHLVKANKTARKYDKRVKQVTVNYADAEQDVIIANNRGTFVSDKRIRTRFTVQVVAATGKVIETGYEGPGLACGFEFFETKKACDIAETAARRAVTLLTAKHSPAGAMPVVLAGKAGGTMIHEACGHALEADFIYKNISVFNGHEGKKVVSNKISVIDDGTLQNNYGSFSYDDEGTPSQKNILIDKGKLVGFMSDLDNANKLKIKPSGNGRRESYRSIPIPRMTNTYIAPGKYSFEEILKSVKKGLLVMQMGGGQVDITNGNFVFEVSEGYLIENGKKGKAVKGATLVGNGIEVLKTIDMVGDDLFFIPGICGKGQSAPVSDGQPTLRIPSITVGGQDH